MGVMEGKVDRNRRNNTGHEMTITEDRYWYMGFIVLFCLLLNVFGISHNKKKLFVEWKHV